MDLKEEDILGADIGRHWYYRSKAAALGAPSPAPPFRHILDVGAGSGFFSRHLLARTAAQSALCVDIGYAADRDEAWPARRFATGARSVATDCDLVLMMDVLEHVDDDCGLVRDYADKVPRGAHFVVTVPAFQFLWSGHDVFLEHKRRYRLAGIERVLRDAGLDVVRGSYYFALVFPLAAAVRLALSQIGRPEAALVPHGALANTLLSAACAAELPLYADQPAGRPVGLRDRRKP